MEMVTGGGDSGTMKTISKRNLLLYAAIDDKRLTYAAFMPSVTLDIIK